MNRRHRILRVLRPDAHVRTPSRTQNKSCEYGHQNPPDVFFMWSHLKPRQYFPTRRPATLLSLPGFRDTLFDLSSGASAQIKSTPT